MIYVLLLSALVVVIVFYVVLHSPKKIVTEKTPYSDFINQELVLKRQAILVRNVKASSYIEPYLLVEENVQLDSEITEKYSIPVGTKFKLNKAVLITNAVSGFTTSVVTGTLYIPTLQKEIRFEYIWGNEHVTLTAGAKSNWTFPQALWQNEENKRSYTF